MVLINHSESGSNSSSPSSPLDPIDSAIEPNDDDNNNADVIAVDDPRQTLDPIIAEQYKIWKKNAPYLYDTLVTANLELPSLTVEWIPEEPRINANGYHIDYRLVLGTQTTGRISVEPNFLIIYRVMIPNFENAKAHYKESNGGYGGVSAKIDQFVKIRHDGDVNRARTNLANTFLIATKTSSPDVLLFDYSKHGTERDADPCRPELILRGHRKEGYGLSWNSIDRNLLLSGSDDGIACVWDIESTGINCQNSPRTLDPILSVEIAAVAKEEEDSSAITDAQWHPFHRHLFGTVGIDRSLRLWDCRKPARRPILGTSPQLHRGDLNALAFNPFNAYAALTASADRRIALWDLRNVSAPLHYFAGHRDEVLQISWSPTQESMFASAGKDRRVLLWDLLRISSAADSEQTEQRCSSDRRNPSELVFMHGGHTDVVSDIAWHLKTPALMASVSDRNEMHIWRRSTDPHGGAHDVKHSRQSSPIKVE